MEITCRGSFVVDLLKREYSGQKAAGQQHAAVQQETRRQQENQDDADDEDEHCDEKCRVDTYFWLTVTALPEGSEPFKYYESEFLTSFYEGSCVVVIEQETFILP